MTTVYKIRNKESGQFLGKFAGYYYDPNNIITNKYGRLFYTENSLFGEIKRNFKTVNDLTKFFEDFEIVEFNLAEVKVDDEFILDRMQTLNVNEAIANYISSYCATYMKKNYTLQNLLPKFLSKHDIDQYYMFMIAQEGQESYMDIKKEFTKQGLSWIKDFKVLDISNGFVGTSMAMAFKNDETLTMINLLFSSKMKFSPVMDLRDLRTIAQYKNSVKYSGLDRALNRVKEYYTNIEEVI